MFSVVFAVVAKSIGWTSETSSPSDLQKVPIRPTKNAHPTYEKCPSDLKKSAHLTYKIEWPSNSNN